MKKTTKFKVTIILDVAEQEIEDMQHNAQNYIKEDIEDNCLYIDNIKIIKEDNLLQQRNVLNNIFDIHSNALLNKIKE